MHNVCHSALPITCVIKTAGFSMCKCWATRTNHMHLPLPLIAFVCELHWFRSARFGAFGWVECWSASVSNSQSTAEWQKFYEYFTIYAQDTLSLRCSLAHSSLSSTRPFGRFRSPLLKLKIQSNVVCIHYFNVFALRAAGACVLCAVAVHSIWFGCCWSRWFQLQMTAGYFMFINKYWILWHCFLCTNFTLSGVVFLVCVCVCVCVEEMRFSKIGLMPTANGVLDQLVNIRMAFLCVQLLFLSFSYGNVLFDLNEQ